MHATEGHIEATESRAAFGTPPIPTRPITWSMTAKAKPHRPFEFESVLLAIAGHDLRQPLQVIEGAHQFLGRGVRTASELRLLQFAQRATDRLRDQLDELVAALQLREHAKGVKLTQVKVDPLLDLLLIDVYDTGIGIARDRMPRMFEAFTRLDPARCDGLGIANTDDCCRHSCGDSQVAPSSQL
jgi:signal transduction histidine kinase